MPPPPRTVGAGAGVDGRDGAPPDLPPPVRELPPDDLPPPVRDVLGRVAGRVVLGRDVPPDDLPPPERDAPPLLPPPPRTAGFAGLAVHPVLRVEVDEEDRPDDLPPPEREVPELLLLPPARDDGLAVRFETFVMCALPGRAGGAASGSEP